jgi:hypothetical protein
VYWHEGAQSSGGVIEISYSQTRKYLSRLSDEYIRMQIGLDVKYNDLEATISV